MIRRRGANWHIVWRENGRKVERSLGTSDEAEARRLADALTSALAARRKAALLSRLLGDAPQVERKPQTRKGLAIADALEVARRHRALSVEHEREWAALCKSLKVIYMHDLTPQICLDYLDERFGNNSAKRYNNVLTLLNVVCSACLVEAGLQASPFAAVMRRRKTEEKHHRPFTREEQARIIAALDGHPYWRLLTLIALYTGLRLESCKRLCPSMIADGMITIVPSKTARFGRAVQIPLTAELADALPVVADDMPYCSAYPAEEYIWYTKERTIFYTQLLDTLNITDSADGAVGFHSWRVTYVTRLEEAGVDERVIRGIVGHTSQRMTDLYNHDSESAKKAKTAIENALK